MYIFHINSLDNKQDDSCVVLLIEAILKLIKRILPFITWVIMHSNNAISYQNTIVTFFIHMLRNSTGLFLSQYIHTEAGYGKGTIDGHFMMMKKTVFACIDA